MATVWATRLNGRVYFTRKFPKLCNGFSYWSGRTETRVHRPSFWLCYAGWRRNAKLKLKEKKPTKVKLARA